MIKITPAQVKKKKQFILDYLKAKNPADGSKLDANANIVNKNIATLETEIHKDINIQINRSLMYDKIEELFGKETALEFNRQIDNYELYLHDSSSLKPYCMSVSMYPFLLHGMTKFGGDATAPKHIQSYCGGFINLAFALSSQVAGAVGTPEWILYMDYFAQKDWGRDYLNTHTRELKELLQHVVYSLNQPAAARGFQCVRSDTTQLSTPKGYKYLNELKEGDMCYVWKNGKIEIQKIQKLNIYNYDSDKDGNLIQFKGRNYQQTATPNHRVLYKKPNTDEYCIKEANKLIGHSKLSLPIGSDGIERADYNIPDPLLKICVATLTDGNIEEKEHSSDNSASRRIRIYKSKKRYGYLEIPQWLQELGINYSVSKCQGNEFGDMVVFTIDSINSKTILELLNNTKKEIPFFLKLLSKRQIKLVLDTWSSFDGLDLDSHAQLLQCDNDSIRDSIQELCTLAGVGSEIYNREMTKINSSEPCVVKYVKLFKRLDKRVSDYNHIEYHGKVWCPTTEAGVVIFREENGIPYITGNSLFWNISIFDKNFLNSMFESFVYPDLTKPDFESVTELQKFFLIWIGEERKKALLTFPVITVAMVVDENEPKDKKLAEFVAEEMAKGNTFFIYESNSVDSLSSCCRLKSELSNNTFSHTLGAGGVATGSINVITLNMNRLVQDNRDLKTEIEKIHKYQVAYRKIIENFKSQGLLPAYDTGFISLDKQFLTIGINGIVEAAESLGLKADNNDKYKKWVKQQLRVIYNANKKAKEQYGYMFNTEFVPAENLGVKNAAWDTRDGYDVPRKVYNSYFFPLEDDKINILDKFILHGKELNQYLDGGSALHINLAEHLDKEQYLQLFRVAAKTGCNYWTINVKATICNECNNIDKSTLKACPKCGSTNIDYATRIIGYIRRISNFSSARQEEEGLRHYGSEKPK